MREGPKGRGVEGRGGGEGKGQGAAAKGSFMFGSVCADAKWVGGWHDSRGGIRERERGKEKAALFS